MEQRVNIKFYVKLKKFRRHSKFNDCNKALELSLKRDKKANTKESSKSRNAKVKATFMFFF